MLKGLATWFLNNYLGKYLEDLNTDQLRIALSQGEVELENAPFRKEAFKFLDPALDVKAGFVGHIKLKIPVSKLRSEPWTLLLERVYILFGPQNFADFDEDLEDQVLLEKKLISLDGIEAEWRSLEEASSGSYDQWKSQGSSFITTILENLQVHIRDVHIRYEDASTSPFSCGLVLESLSAETCDENWLPKFVAREDSSQTHIFKTLDLRYLGLYLNVGSEANIFGEDVINDIPRLSTKMCDTSSLHYLLKPVSLNATLKKNCQIRALKSLRKPRFVIDVKVNSIPLELSNAQYSCALHGLRAFHQLRKNRRVWKWRPRDPVKDSPREWWTYAIASHMEVIHQRNAAQSWAVVLSKASENVRYARVFREYLLNPLGLSQETKDFKDSLDAGRPYEELKILRSQVVLGLKAELSSSNNEKKSLSWYEWWYGIEGSPVAVVGSDNEDEDEIDPDRELYHHKDAMLAQINFSLESGSLKLFSASDDEKREVFEFKFEKMKSNFESRPRTKSVKFEISLGALYLKDRISTEASMFPILISPANVQGAPLCPAGRTFSGIARSTFQSLLGKPEENSVLFYLLFETNPTRQLDVRLHCRSQSLNIVYNPIIVPFITDFLRIPSDLNKSTNLSEKIKSAALHRIEEAKQRTKKELKRNLLFDDGPEGLLSGRKILDISFELSAPQILIPESFVDRNALIFVVDFGKLHLSNGYCEPSVVARKAFEGSDEDDDDEEFCTPVSTPEDLEEDDPPPSLPVVPDASKLYNSFSLTLSDMQVLISQIKDNWKYAHLKGTSTHHVLDKFSIKLTLEKRIPAPLLEDDLPNIVISGSLPRIVVHFNEEKIFALKRMAHLLSGQDSSSLRIPKNCVSISTQTFSSSKEDTGGPPKETTFSPWASAPSTSSYSSRFLFIYFCIDDLAIELQSQDKSIAEVQVTGVKASLSRRLYDTSMFLSVHSLLVVDAVQTFGPNFELLVASHRDVSVDSISGSLRGSEPVSPIYSPRSPPSSSLHKALLNDTSSSLHIPKTIDPDALIMIEVTIVKTEEDPSDEDKIVSVQFNSLDIIANQETIIELIAFMKRISPDEDDEVTGRATARRRRVHLPLKDSGTQTTAAPEWEGWSRDSGCLESNATEYFESMSYITVLTVDFERLNVLLLRANTGKMIGTALLTEVKIYSSFGKLVNVSGSLGGLHVINLLSGSSLHQKIVSIGKDPFNEGNNTGDLWFNKSAHEKMNNSGSTSQQQVEEDIQAFRFNLTKKQLDESTVSTKESMDIQIRIASVCYTHSSSFIHELNSCASDFKTYMSNLASSIRSAATEMALGIVHHHRRTDSVSVAHDPVIVITPSNNSSLFSDGGYKLNLDVLVETPVIVLPSHERSFEVLVAHLGEISIHNETTTPHNAHKWSTEKYVLSIKDMNVFSMDLRSRFKESDLLDLLAQFKVMTSKELYAYHPEHSIPILHDTGVDLILNKGLRNTLRKSESVQSFGSFSEEPHTHVPSYIVDCVMSDTLKITINRSQYEQILLSLRSPSKDADPPSQQRNHRRGSTSLEEEPRAMHFTSSIFEGNFRIPHLIVKLRDSNDSDLVNVIFQDFAVCYKKSDSLKYNLDIILKSLTMEDLLLPNGLRHRQLMTSIGPSHIGALGKSFRNGGLSRSTPNLRKMKGGGLLPSGSLPSSLNVETIFGIPLSDEPSEKGGRFGSSSSLSVNDSSTTHPSKSDITSADTKNLVHIKIEEYEDSADWTEDEPLKKLVDIDFNNLDIVINLKTWVSVLDFFNVGAPASNTTTTTKSPSPPSWGTRSRFESTHSNSGCESRKSSGYTKIDLRVKSLSVLLNKPTVELSKISVNNFAAKMKSSDLDFSINGHLGSFSLKDLTPSGRLYSDRFISRKRSNRVLLFDFFKHSASDDKLEREFDASLRLHMDQVIYVHTQRFYSELSAFFAEFSSLQKSLLSSSVEDRKAEDDLNFIRSASRAMRLKLDIVADSTTIFLPMSSYSSRIISVDLGQISVRNHFAFSGDPCTISPQALSTTLVGQLSRAQSCESLSSRRSRSRLSSRRRVYNSGDADDDPKGSILVNDLHHCLLDVLHIHLKSLDLKMGDRISGFTDEKFRTPLDVNVHGFIVRLSSKQLLKEKCELKLQLERNLDRAFSHRVPDVSLKGTLSKVHALVNRDQYESIRGLLSYNIGEPIEEEEEINNHNESAGRNEEWLTDGQMLYGDKTWTRLFMNIELQDVILDLQEEDEGNKCILARINFYRSKLIYESWSDASRDVDLVSQEICLSDCRYLDLPVDERPNVFSKVLFPMKDVNDFGNLQAEVHYRSTPELNRLTILLNNMRLLCVFDWWTRVLSFISIHPSPPPEFVKGRSDEAESRFVYLEEEPFYPSVGIISKRAPMIETCGPVFELNINITDSEIVILAEPFNEHSQAIILHSTTVIAYRPDMGEKPFSCNLNNAEVFSCVLGREESVLSIVDPVTINLEIGTPYPSIASSSNKGLNYLGDEDKLERSLEVQMQQLNLRLSYHDWIIIQYILKLFPQQAKAAFYKEEEAPPKSHYVDEDDDENDKPYFSGSRLSFSSMELKTNLFNICIIDDCKDADVPLLELSLGRLQLRHDISKSGSLSCDGQASYYNRVFGSWEPLIEPFLGGIDWNVRGRRHVINLRSEDILNINLTSSLIRLYRTVTNNWTEDYLALSDQRMRSRIPFVPYALKNETGSDLQFLTYVSQASEQKKKTSPLSKDSSSASMMDWKAVPNGATHPFTFVERGKFRQINSREIKSHQIVLRVGEWAELCPVSVDQVGTYFRHVKAAPRFAHKVPPARIVIEVSLEGSARKLVKVRSALLVANKLPYPVRLILDKVHSKNSLEIEVGLREVVSVPLSYVWATLHVKPSVGDWEYCGRNVEYSHVKSSSSPSINAFDCKHSWNKIQEPERFCATVERLNFPSDEKMADNNWIQPAHIISLASPVTIVNLLPYQLSYTLKHSCIQSRLDPGHEICLSVDLSQSSTFHISVDQFPQGSDIILPPGPTTSFDLRVRLGDASNRPLYLNAQVTIRGIVRISIFSTYWLVNKTGLPLIFREEKGLSSSHHSAEEAAASEEELVAGQEPEHEIARMAEPLAFSFSEENKETLSMRIGNELHPREGTSPAWCKAFYIQQKGSFVRRLRVLNATERKEIVYNIGVDIVSGRDQFDKTLIVTLTPRIQLHNRSMYRILFAQKCQVFTQEETTAYLESPPGSSVSYHWPHLEEEHLLVVKLPELPHCSWSGGFLLENSDSFQFNVRDGSGRSVLLRVEIGLVGATYSVIFADAKFFPPPFRVDNHSHVPISFYQNGCSQSTTVCKPRVSVPYALDEPTLKPILTCVAPGYSTGEYDLNRIGEGPQLSYENFIYIALSSTFTGEPSYPGLVLDLESGTNRVILAQKLSGKRSQLWRMTPSGLLQHEGSSAPRDPNHPKDSSSEPIVLDIAGPAVQPHAYIPLVLRKADNRRRLTQRWKFMHSGRLCCEHKGLYVQAKSDLVGTSLVLGPNEYEGDPNPVQLGFTRHRMRPGSGVLSVFVHTDGPTRVLLIQDAIQQGEGGELRRELEASSSVDYTVSLNLRQGIGLSFISSEPAEELIYGLLSNVQVEYATRNGLHILDVGVQSVQIDNQIYDAQYPSILYPCPPTKNDEYRHMPSVHFTASKQRHTSLHNAEIFENMILTLKSMTLNLEEELICKMVKWAGLLDLGSGGGGNAPRGNFSNAFEENQESMISNTISATRYYFGTLKIGLHSVRLSVLKSNRLKGDVRLIQRRLNLFLITFESANIKLEPYCKNHPFETATFLLNSILKHYQQEMVRKTFLILGSTDFLGNPAGLANDWIEGLRDLLDGRMVNSLINMTHGAANTAAKFSGSLSYGMSKISLQEKYDERRLMLRGKHGETSRRHLVAALKGLGFGALGGVTSLYDEVKGGVRDDGAYGIFNGILWGLAGVVMKPAIGVLDFAAEAATAIKESSKTVTNVRPTKIRPCRPIYTPAGPFPIYNKKHASGQERLSKINGHPREVYVSDERFVYGHIESDVIVSFERILVFQKVHSASNRGNPIATSRPELDISYGSVDLVKVVRDGSLWILEIHTNSNEGGGVFKVMGEDEKKVLDLCLKINYAMSIFQELQFALPSKESNNGDLDSIAFSSEY